MKAAILVFAMLMGSLALGQAQPQQKTASETPAARTSDVNSIDGIIAALYDVISGPAGQKRDWNRLRSLFWPDAHLIPLVTPPGKSGAAARVHSVDDFVTQGESYFAKNSFYESAVANRVEQWAHIAQVFSSYESSYAKGEKPFARGINSIQLFNDGQRWWVLSIFWEDESEQHPLPERMLKSPAKE